MKITYDKQADAMFIRFNEQKHAKTQVVNELINLDFSADGTLIGIELLRTSRFQDDVQELIYRVVGETADVEKVKA
jgi:uncharacterized protein YuzE